jgi:hypothetical protein
MPGGRYRLGKVSEEGDVEKALQKLAQQVMAFDEASLDALWEKYLNAVRMFEPTRNWEESAVMLGIIQTVRWKNHLFNHHWKEGSEPRGIEGSRLPQPKKGKEESGHGLGDGRDQRGKVLRFRPREDDDSI